jgi:hypothetical protein
MEKKIDNKCDLDVLTSIIDGQVEYLRESINELLKKKKLDKTEVSNLLKLSFNIGKAAGAKDQFLDTFWKLTGKEKEELLKKLDNKEQTDGNL